MREGTGTKLKGIEHTPCPGVHTLIVVSPSDRRPLAWNEKCSVGRDGTCLISMNALHMVIHRRVDILERHRSISGAASVVCRAVTSGISEDTSRELAGGRVFENDQP